MRSIFTIFILLLGTSTCFSQYHFEQFSRSKKQNFSKIKRHILKKSGQLTSLEAIANSINTIAKSELEKVYGAFYWVSNEITYDMVSLNANASVPSEPEQVLKSKLAVCSGYSELFHAICQELQIESKIINGYSKGYGYVKGTSFTISNHAWNSVKINGKWFFIDTTWASPNNNLIRSDNKSDNKVNDFYFLPNPQLFVSDHLPEDPSWQLLSPIITLHQFEKNENEVLNQSKFSLIINTKEKDFATYIDVAAYEIAVRQRILDFNPKNKTAVYRLGVATMYQALDILESLHELNHSNVLIELPINKYKMYELLDKAAFHFKGALSSSNTDIRKSATTFLDETIYQRGVFNYEAAQIIFDTTTRIERDKVLLLKDDFNLMIDQYFDIAIDYFKTIPIHSWYYENANDYIRIITDTRSDLLIK